jgi:AcrR family transcriptional regulator
VPRPARAGAHQALLEAARAEFSRRGLEQARVEDIARRAGVSKGAFYLHFRSKEEAFGQILQRLLGALEENAHRRAEAEERYAAEAPPGDRALEHRLEFECALDVEFLELLWRNRQLLGALDSAGGSPANARRVADFRRRMRALVSARIADQQRAGDLRDDVDPDMLGDLVVGTYEAFARRMIDLAERPDLRRWARSFLLAVYQGVLLRRPTPRPSPLPGRRAAADG